MADVDAVLLHPHIGPNLAAQLLVNGARTVGFGKFMRHGATEYGLPRLSARFDVEHDAYWNGPGPIVTAPERCRRRPCPDQDANG
jgi:hypothetical protein